MLFRALNRAHIALYRASKGRVLGAIVGSPVLLLTTTGRKTGKQRTIPLVYTRDGESFAVIATDRPAWHTNLKGNPQAAVEVKGQTYRIVAREANEDEEKRLWAQFIAQSPAFKSQQGQPNHEIVILVLE
jgi:deazaflavin-dependent oxidoreductase (nitroreductase family)